MPAAFAPVRPDLRRQVADKAENRPGIYRFTGPRGEVLYVGKSVRVRTRLLSYFRGHVGTREFELLRSARDVEWEYTPNEFEALLRELRLIRSVRPRFNVRHRRERRFAWVRLTADAAPRFVATRTPQPDGSRYFGPFPAGRGLPGVLNDLARATGVRDCAKRTPMHFADQLELVPSQRTPACLRGETGSCPAPCAGHCTAGEYRERVDEAVAFLEGKSDAPLLRLRERLDAASARHEFESAARVRDWIQRLEDLRQRIQLFQDQLRRLRFVYEPSASAAARRAYLILDGRVRLSWDPGDVHGPDQETLAQRLHRLCRETPTPPHQLTASEREELFLVARWFRRHPDELERTHALEEAPGKLRPGFVPFPGRSGTPPPGPAEPTGASASPAPSPAARSAP